MANDHSSFKTSKIRVSACPGKNRKKMHKRICFHITIKSPIQDFFFFFFLVRLTVASWFKVWR